MKQGEFATKVGVTQGAIQKYEAGENFPGLGVLKKIADFGEVTVGWLLEGEGAPGDPRESAPAAYQKDRDHFDVELLADTIAQVEDYLKRRHLKLTLIQRARLIALVYQQCWEHGDKPDYRLIKGFSWIAEGK